MPNWCENILVISGDERHVLAFRDKARGKTQTYQEVKELREESWGGFESIKVKALFSVPPELGSEEDLSFHALFPVPDKLRSLPYDSGLAMQVCQIMEVPYKTCGYEWEIQNWGVKWGAKETSLIQSFSGLLEYEFSTPWEPPMGWLTKVAKDWPELTFELEYSEPGMGFAGRVQLEDGKLVYEDHNDTYESY